MKTLLLFCVAAAMAFPISQSIGAEPNKEANKLAVTGSQAAKDKDWDTAIDNLRKATEMDRKYAPNLAAALQQRATDATRQNRFPDAITDFNDAIKAHATASAYEGRAFVYTRMNDIEHALADYSEAIKMSPGEARLYSYRAHTLANKGDLKSALVDTEKVLKLKKGDADAQALRTWIETRLKNQNAPGSTPAPPPQPTRGR